VNVLLPKPLPQAGGKRRVTCAAAVL
jgi:hypothetical protein